MIKGIVAGIWNFILKVYGLFMKRIVVYKYPCSHCGIEYQSEYLVLNILRRDFGNGKYAIYYFRFCPVCVLIEPNFHHFELGNDCKGRFFWENDEGKIYEFYKFKKDRNGSNKTNRQ